MTIRLSTRRCLAAVSLVILLLAAAGFRKAEHVQRYGAVIGVNPERLEYYKELHANPWPTVNKAVKEAGIRNYSIYLTQFDDGKWYLFGYFEYTGNDFEADMTP